MRLMTETRAGDLEATLADVGTLLVRLEKYRLEAHPEAGPLRASAIDLGNEARRLHRRGLLEGDAAASLLARTDQNRRALTRLLDAIQSGSDYQAAVEAHHRGDSAVLAALWPRLFVGVESGPAPNVAYHPVDWQRRGRPRVPAEIAASVKAQLLDGLDAAGDELSPGADPRLPVVSLTLHWPDGAPLALRFAGADLPPPLLHRPDVGEVLLPVRCFRGPAVVELAHASADVDEWAGDLTAFHARVVPALEAAGIVVTASTMPAASK
jgi:hypothetical protein